MGRAVLAFLACLPLLMPPSMCLCRLIPRSCGVEFVGPPTQADGESVHACPCCHDEDDHLATAGVPGKDADAERSVADDTPDDVPLAPHLVGCPGLQPAAGGPQPALSALAIDFISIPGPTGRNPEVRCPLREDAPTTPLSLTHRVLLI